MLGTDRTFRASGSATRNTHDTTLVTLSVCFYWLVEANSESPLDMEVSPETFSEGHL